jgi:hypothetical protein
MSLSLFVSPFISDSLMCSSISWQTIALRDIVAGEEIVYDYGTSKPLLSLPWSCRCGTSSCRLRVTKDDWQRSDLKTKFGRVFPCPFSLLCHAYNHCFAFGQHWASHCLALIDKAASAAHGAAIAIGTNVTK